MTVPAATNAVWGMEECRPSSSFSSFLKKQVSLVFQTPISELVGNYESNTFSQTCALSTPGAYSEEIDDSTLDLGDRSRWSWRWMTTRGRRRSCTWQGHQDSRWNCKANIILFYTDAGAQHSVQEWGWLSKWWTSRRRRCHQDDFFIISYFFSFNTVSILGQIIFHLKFLPLAHVIWKHCAFFL